MAYHANRRVVVEFVHNTLTLEDGHGAVDAQERDVVAHRLEQVQFDDVDHRLELAKDKGAVGRCRVCTRWAYLSTKQPQKRQSNSYPWTRECRSRSCTGFAAGQAALVRRRQSATAGCGSHLTGRPHQRARTSTTSQTPRPRHRA